MHIDRAIEVINLLYVPEKKRKFWPQLSMVVIDKTGNIIDVVQSYENDPIKLAKESLAYYPGATCFAAQVGWYKTTEELKVRINQNLEDGDDGVYRVGGSQKKDKRWVFWRKDT